MTLNIIRIFIFKIISVSLNVFVFGNCCCVFICIYLCMHMCVGVHNIIVSVCTIIVISLVGTVHVVEWVVAKYKLIIVVYIVR